MLTEEERAALLDEVRWAIWHVAADTVGVNPYVVAPTCDGQRGRRRERRDPASVSRGPGRNAALAHVAVAELVAKEVARIAADAARRAAELGADYAEIGQAAGITRQGARRRWPDLAQLTAAARTRNDPRPSTPDTRAPPPPAGPPPQFRHPKGPQ